jgi:3-deoxy-D-manno-octulosonate 8-phosphate phosphatase (KDO 8-P phosphatase)
MHLPENDIEARAKQIRLLLLDVDGVLTDGTLGVTGAGDELKSFFVRDGAAIVWAQQAGIEIGLLSGRTSDATAKRASELRITTVIQGETDKGAAFAQLAAARGLTEDQMAFMGDDLLDLPALLRAGLSAAPADACTDVRNRVHYVTTAPGGRGAVREFIELMLRRRGQWDAVVQRHLR